MVAYATYDIHLIGLQDVGKASRTRFLTTMERLTGRAPSEFESAFEDPEQPLFRSLEQRKADMIWKALDEVGALLEVRPRSGAAVEADDVATTACPNCGFVLAAGAPECSRCGVVFSKVDREEIQKMQQDSHLEEALQKALQVREEWNQRAKQYLESHPLPADATAGFEKELQREEIPFLRLTADESAILMTSRRMLSQTKTGAVASIPYELIADVDVGGGLVVKRNRVRLALTFHSEIPFGGQHTKSATWQLDKESAFYKDVIMDWAFARNFMCGQCGERDLDFRIEGSSPHARCMHCATDHEIDLVDAIAIPRIQD
jgi:hypothetical protein